MEYQNLSIDAKPTADDLSMSPASVAEEQEGQQQGSEQEVGVEAALPTSNGKKGAAESEDTVKFGHKFLLGAGAFCILLLIAAILLVFGLTGLVFVHSPAPAESATGGFDFNDLEPDFSDVATSSAAPTSIVETLTPTASPTQAPSSPPSSSPSSSPSTSPTASPSNEPTLVHSSSPSDRPSVRGSMSPTIETLSPTSVPSQSLAPTTFEPTPLASNSPTYAPVTPAPVTPIDYDSDTLLTFCVIADVPYFDNEKARLPGQIENEMDGCEFLVHLGDIMKGGNGCPAANYELVQEMLLDSAIPTFIVPGDNEWNDCGNQVQIGNAWGRWTRYFLNLENRWNHSFGVIRQIDYPENFYFIHKGTLVFGLNIVGGRVHDRDEWYLRLTAEVEWVRAVVRMNVPMHAAGVIVMAHARPTDDHVHFFDPLRDFIRDELQNEVPVLYLHGDGHDFIYTQNYYRQSNYLRIQHEGGVRHPILKILADPMRLGPEVYNAFQYDQQF